MRNNRWISICVGLFVILAIAGLFFLGFKASKLGGYNPGDVYQVNAQFGDISGLGKQAKVSLAGVQIGRVTGITLDEKSGDAIAHLEISKNISLPEDTSAQILTSGLLGEKYIGLVRGRAKTPLKNGATLTNTSGSVVLEKAIQQFTGASGGFYPAKSYHLSAKFNDVSGLSVGAPVKLGGVQIGQVASIALDMQSYQAVVTMDIAAQYNQLPIDSSADILSSSLLGGKYIGVSPGGEMQMLKDGGQFQYTTSSIVLEKLISQIVTSMGGKK